VTAAVTPAVPKNAHASSNRGLMPVKTLNNCDPPHAYPHPCSAIVFYTDATFTRFVFHKYDPSCIFLLRARTSESLLSDPSSHGRVLHLRLTDCSVARIVTSRGRGLALLRGKSAAAGLPEVALSRARRIRELLEAGKKPAEIAALVDCRPEYVRVVRRRGLNPERVQARDSAYKRRRYHTDAEYRERGQGGRSHAQESGEDAGARAAISAGRVTRPYRWRAENLLTMGNSSVPAQR
jgi:hypothetical protein